MTLPHDISVELEFTPNPNTLKYVTNVSLLLSGAVNFKTIEETVDRSALAEKVFRLGGISAVMVGKNFITVTLSDQDSLTELNDRIIDAMRSFLASGEAAVRLDAIPSQESSLEGRTEIEQKIIKILDEDIRPAVAMDGGDITFEKYQDGIVFLHMKGSCAGCPSSTATLKMGIENRLRSAIPEVQEVVSV